MADAQIETQSQILEVRLPVSGNVTQDIHPSFSVWNVNVQTAGLEPVHALMAASMRSLSESFGIMPPAGSRAAASADGPYVSIGGSPDPDTETAIISRISYGRQIGRLAEALLAVIDIVDALHPGLLSGEEAAQAAHGRSVTLTEEQRASVRDLRSLTDQVRSIKEMRKPLR